MIHNEKGLSCSNGSILHSFDVEVKNCIPWSYRVSNIMTLMNQMNVW